MENKELSIIAHRMLDAVEALQKELVEIINFTHQRGRTFCATTPEVREKIKRLAASGVTAHHIAKKLEVSETTVYKYAGDEIKKQKKGNSNNA